MTWRGAVGKKFYLKMISGGIIIEKSYPLILFYGKNLAKFVLMFGTQLYCELEVPNAGVTLF
jgi:hypothetical protein